MAKRILFSAVLVFLLLGAGLIYALQTNPADRPPGIDVSVWLPLNDQAGIVLKQVSPARGLPKSGIHGTLMVKSGNIWQALNLDAGPPTVLPVNR